MLNAPIARAKVRGGIAGVKVLRGGIAGVKVRGGMARVESLRRVATRDGWGVVEGVHLLIESHVDGYSMITGYQFLSSIHYTDASSDEGSEGICVLGWVVGLWLAGRARSLWGEGSAKWTNGRRLRGIATVADLCAQNNAFEMGSSYLLAWLDCGMDDFSANRGLSN